MSLSGQYNDVNGLMEHGIQLVTPISICDVVPFCSQSKTVSFFKSCQGRDHIYFFVSQCVTTTGSQLQYTSHTTTLSRTIVYFISLAFLWYQDSAFSMPTIMWLACFWSFLHFVTPHENDVHIILAKADFQ